VPERATPEKNRSGKLRAVPPDIAGRQVRMSARDFLVALGRASGRVDDVSSARPAQTLASNTQVTASSSAKADVMCFNMRCAVG
jgi:hypothetical protein